MLAVIILNGDKICRFVDSGKTASVVAVATRLFAEMSGVRNFSLQTSRPARAGLDVCLLFKGYRGSFPRVK